MIPAQVKEAVSESLSFFCWAMSVSSWVGFSCGLHARPAGTTHPALATVERSETNKNELEEARSNYRATELMD
jgi:nicotinamide mononucleotide (NMN) deamidase PncC